MKILIVDDDEMIREVMTDIFVDFANSILVAENGTKAIELVIQEKPDVVLSDVRMPGGDGIFLAEQINDLSQLPRPKLFLCSGHNDLNNSDLNRLNITHLFDKPFDPDELIKVILSHVPSCIS